VAIADSGLRIRACAPRRQCATPTRIIPPALRTRPQITGTYTDGATLRASSGTWAGASGYTYLWEQSRGNSWVRAAGSATSATYRVGAAAGSLRVRVIARNAGGSSTPAYSAPLRASTPPPVATRAPEVSGRAQVGITLTSRGGSWNGATAGSQRWQRSADGTTWSDIPGATSGSYPIPAADVGLRLRLVETATNAGGATESASAATDAVLPQAPTASRAPAIAGTATEGGSLTADEGAWERAQETTRSWLRCAGDGGACADTGASGATYELAAADAGKAIVLRITATNAGGSTVADSAPTSAVIPYAPVSTAAASVSGTPRTGTTFTANRGTWTSAVAPTYAYQWQYSVNGVTTWTDIPGATAQAFTPTSAEGSRYLRVTVTASNAGGSTTSTSDASAQVEEAPYALTPPAIAGTATEGQTLAVSDGAWRATPAVTGYTYQWQRQDANTGEWVAIAGQTTSSYTLAAADRGVRVRAIVTATNPIGSTAEPAFATDPVGFIPANATAPTLSDASPGVGQTLTADTGSWSATPGISAFGYQWQTSANGTDWNDVPGATGDTFLVTGDEEGDLLRVQVTATNALGTSAPATSSATSAVVPRAIPANITQPSVSDATPGTGQTISAITGTWTDWPPITSYGYQWQSSPDGAAWTETLGIVPPATRGGVLP